MYYSSVPQVRTVSGIFENRNISDALVQSKILQADSLINGMISDVYTLPLNIFWQNTITFSGEGTGSGTMIITINSIDYAIAVVDGQTADGAADLFRKAVLTSTSLASFEVGDTDNDSVVRLSAMNMDDTDAVTITSTNPQTVEGITATGVSVFPGAHPLISNLSAEIAGAYILMIAYGKESEDTDKDGNKRLEQALVMIGKIQGKAIKLFDSAGTELTVAELARMSFYPNNTSSDGSGDENDTSARFSTNQEF